MRSYSSVLAHVLGNSPEIDGYGETHLQYRDKHDLCRLRKKVAHSTGVIPRGRWLLDKVLQNNILLPDDMIVKGNMRAIIFLRSPESTIRSIVTMLRARKRDPSFPVPSPDWACDYYVSRLHRLRMDGERLGKYGIYFDAEALIHHTHGILDSLSNWLELKLPLTPSYQVSLRTGEFGFGDPSSNIYAGRILNSTVSTIARDIYIPKSTLLEAEAAYQRCRDSLLKHCQVDSVGIWRRDMNWQELLST